MGAGVAGLTTDELTLLAEAASDVTFTAGMDGRTTWVSSGVANLLGWTPEEMIGRPFFDFVHPGDHQAVAAARAGADASGTVRYRVRVLQKDGSHRWVDILLRTRRDAAGEPLGRFGSWRDAEEEVRLQAALEAEVLRGREILDGMLDPWVLLTPVRDDADRIVDFVFADANVRACEYNGVSYTDLIGARLLELLPGHRGSGLFGAYVHVMESGDPLALDDYVYPREVFGGADRRYDIVVVRVADGISYTWRDVTNRYEAAQRLAESEERFRLLSTNATEMVALWRDGRCVWASPSTLAFLGVELEEIVGLEGRSLVVSEDLARFDEAYAAAAAGEVLLARVRICGPDGTVHWVEVHAGPYLDTRGEHRGILTSTRVIDDLVHAEQELEHQARFDLLTGLMNRTEVLRTVTRLAAQHPRTGAEVAILFCDIDRFKEINDAYGHAAGDGVLRTIGERLSATIRSDDYAARIGGDELLVVLTGVHSLDEAASIAEKIRRSASEPIPLEDGVRITPSLSIGVTLAHPGETTDTLLDRADNAMYEAKRNGRDRVVAIG